jgi:hypothetical protein
VRRTRLDGDSWASDDVPLGEEEELYSVQVVSGETVVREVRTSTPAWTYLAGDRAADAAEAPYTIGVAQVSSRFGPGPYRRIEIHE